MSGGSRGCGLLAMCLLALLAAHATAFTVPAAGFLGGRLGQRAAAGRRAAPRVGLRMMSDATIPTELEAIVETNDRYAEGMEKVKAANVELLPHLSKLRKQRFFRYYAVDLLSSCTYFPTVEFPCEMDKCDVENAEDVPDDIRERDLTEHDFRLDGWVRWDMPGDFTDYYDLVKIKERYTEYDGSRVWKFIHEKIAFKNVEDPMNAWKIDYNRALSGLHTSISAHILESMDLDPEASIAEYKRRIRDVPGAVDSLYFAYMLMLVAIQDAEPRLKTCTYMGTASAVHPSMSAILDHPVITDPAVQQAAQAMRKHASTKNIKPKIWKARLRTRDLLGIMNCVQCNVCRLHGKVASLGLGVGFQVLLGSGEPEDVSTTFEKLHRVEVAALITTTAKFATAVEIVKKYEELCGQEA